MTDGTVIDMQIFNTSEYRVNDKFTNAAAPDAAVRTLKNQLKNKHFMQATTWEGTSSSPSSSRAPTRR